MASQNAALTALRQLCGTARFSFSGRHQSSRGLYTGAGLWGQAGCSHPGICSSTQCGCSCSACSTSASSMQPATAPALSSSASLVSHSRTYSAAAAGDRIEWVFLGPPGVGKGTYASRAAKAFGVAHIATGDLIRDEIKNKTALGAKVGTSASCMQRA